MHNISVELMGQAIAEFVPAAARVLDVGSRSMNGPDRDGSYRAATCGRLYVGADIADGPNVDVVMPDPYTLPFEDGEFGAVISGQTLEHCREPYRLVREMARVLAPGGHMILIAPSSGPIHDAPMDYWRIMPDGMRALGEEAGLEVIEIGRAERVYDAEIEQGRWSASAPLWYDVRGIMRRPA